MKTNKDKKDFFFTGSLLFGLFFGAGNLILPVSMGQSAGSFFKIANAGFLITATGVPLLGIVAIALTSSKGVFELSSRVSKAYAYFFTTMLYLTIGPMFALPRTATIPFEFGLVPIVPSEYLRLALFIFTLIFFVTALLISLRQGKLLLWIGKFLNPLFLLFLSFLFIKIILNPMGIADGFEPQGKFALTPVAEGLISGYQTMDALAALAFGGIIVSTIKSLGHINPKKIAGLTIKSGIMSSLLMCVIYSILTWLGATSLNLFAPSANGGIALSEISRHYLGKFGNIFFAITITIACLKTAIGLISACAKTFSDLFPRTLGYKQYSVCFALFSFAVSNIGLSAIIRLSLPILMLLYPLAITLIILGVTENFFHKSRYIYVLTTVGALSISVGDFFAALPDSVKSFRIIAEISSFYKNHIPFFESGFGWVIPAFIGFIIGFLVTLAHNKKLK